MDEIDIDGINKTLIITEIVLMKNIITYNKLMNNKSTKM